MPAATGWCACAAPHERRLLMRSVGADIQFRRSNRLDVCLVINHPIALYAYPHRSSTTLTSHSVFLPAADIPSFVGNGNVDLGITGHDVILEANMQHKVTEIQRLAFGKCALQVQVPEHSPIKTVEDLAGKRVVTSFEDIAGAYFSQLDDRLALVGEQRTKIQYIGGSVEAACALGLADGIGACDPPLPFITLTSTQSTSWVRVRAGSRGSTDRAGQNRAIRCVRRGCKPLRRSSKLRRS